MHQFYHTMRQFGVCGPQSSLILFSEVFADFERVSSKFDDFLQLSEIFQLSEILSEYVRGVPSVSLKVEYLIA